MGLGRFIEVEAEGAGDYEAEREKVLAIMGRLGLVDFIRSSYLELLEESELGLAAGKREKI